MTFGFSTAKGSRDQGSLPQYEKRKPKPRQPSDRLKLKRGKTDDLKMLRPRQPSDRLKLKGRGKTDNFKMLRLRRPSDRDCEREI